MCDLIGQAEREMKAAAKERRQKMVEEERERKKEAKALEAVAKKAELEEKRMDRVYKKLEEKVRLTALHEDIVVAHHEDNALNYRLGLKQL